MSPQEELQSTETLVVGGTGFIGRHVLLERIAAGHGVISLSRRPNYEWIDRFAPSARIATVDQMDRATDNLRTLIWAGGGSTPGHFSDRPWSELDAAVAPVIRAATIAAAKGAHFIFLSSGGAVYGDSEGPELIREDHPLRPRSSYGMAKQMAEAGLAFLERAKGLRLTILRPANPVGRWHSNPEQGVVAALFRSARRDIPFGMFGDGSVIRDLFAVEDLANAIGMVADHPDKAVGRVFNVGSGEGHSIAALHRTACGIAGREIAVNRMPARPEDPARIVLDTTAIRNAVGWHPQISLNELMRAVWDATADAKP